MSSSKLYAIADAASALARLAREIAEEQEEQVRQSDALLPLAEAARLAATSQRVIREAIRRGDLQAYGRERDRSVRRVDLDAWVEHRRFASVEGIDDPDMARRFARLAARSAKP